MKLNYECLRATLLAIESVDYVAEDDEGNISYEEFTFDNLVELMKKRKEKYSKTDIFYSVQNLKQAGYISTSEQWADGCPDLFCINFITYQGHKFLDTIRDNQVWSTTKGIISKFASVSVSMVENIAAQVITNMINQYMTQNPTPIN